MRAKTLVNLASSGLIIASTFLPWIRYSIGITMSAVQATDSWLAVFLVLAGGVILLVSRYGGLLTMFGVWLFVVSPPSLDLMLAYNVIVTHSYQNGVWLAWAGATVSLFGSSWTLPFGFRTESDRKVLAMGMLPVGVTVLILGLLLQFSQGGSFPATIPFGLVLSLFGLILAGAGLALLPSWRDSRFFDKIRKLVEAFLLGRQRAPPDPARTD